MLWLPLLAGPSFTQTPSPAGPDSLSLRYTYRDDAGSAPLLRDASGAAWTPLVEVAEFYGIQVAYQNSTGRLELRRGDHKVVSVLSHPSALVDGVESLPIVPLRILEGRLVADPGAAADLVRATLGVQALYVEDKGVLMVGGVTPQDISKEIDADPSAGGTAQVEAAPILGTVATVPVPPAEPTAGAGVTLPSGVEQVARVSLTARKAYHVRRIVIDPGHGGRDGGAKGFDGRYLEKQATLDIALQVVKILKNQPDLEALMTRKTDKYITLQYRTEYANRNKADLFVSIHCNANRKSTARGTETYVYSSHATGYAADAAARENAGGDFMDFTISDLNHNAYRKRSFFLAQMVDKNIRDRLGQKILRIEQAPFYVLARVNMPSILVETAFITHREEERKLKDPEWRGKIAQAIADGILQYRDKVEDSLEGNKVGR